MVNEQKNKDFNSDSNQHPTGTKSHAPSIKSCWLFLTVFFFFKLAFFFVISLTLVVINYQLYPLSKLRI